MSCVRKTLCFAPVAATAIFSSIAPAAAQVPAQSLRALNARSLVISVAVFGKDERAPLKPNHSALDGKIGVITVRGTSTCTAFCVAPDVIATASHCLFGTAQSREPPPLAAITFNVGAGETAQSSRLAGTGLSGIRSNIRAGTSHLRVTPPIDAANDWAVARLESPACQEGALTLSGANRDEIEARAAADEVYQVAMHRDVSARTLVQDTACAIAQDFPGAKAETVARDFSNPAAVLLHACDTGPGSSGSPLLVDGENGPEVVGINVGTYVLSRLSEKDADGGAHEVSEPIANTAVAVSQFRDAARSFPVLTGSISTPPPLLLNSRARLSPPFEE